MEEDSSGIIASIILFFLILFFSCLCFCKTYCIVEPEENTPLLKNNENSSTNNFISESSL